MTRSLKDCESRSVSRSKYTLRLLGIAEQDLAEIITYIAADNLKAAEDLLARFEKALHNLGEHPHIGRIPDDAELLRLRYRHLIVDNYLVFYVVERRNIIVHRITHGARDYKGFL